MADAPKSVEIARAVKTSPHLQLGQIEDARAEAAEVLRVQPNFTISGTVRQLVAFKDPEDETHYFEGLRKAGLPE